KKTVRWFLNCNRYSDEAYGNQDLFICYREVFNDKRLNPMNRSLCLHNFNYNLYRQTNYGKRQGKCYIVRKGANRVDLPQYFDGLIVDNLSEIEKVKVFNNCKYCISYDTQTFYSTIASICGCISIVVTEKGKSRKDYCGTGEIIYGVAYGWEEEEINFALKTREKMLEKIVERQRQNLAETQAFVNLCMAFFNNDLNIYEEIVK
ncbi:MAG: hypothetical protein SPF70_04785, partial [Lachnospiraceae bacterium]|nr:hypothetical protein [Lachnospiraceae bacterium]